MARFIYLIPIFLLISCSTTKEERETEERENEDIQRDYKVIDASSRVRPGWVQDAEVWAKNHGKDVKENRYFSYETEPMVSRATSCQLAKSRIRADIAGEISTFIDQRFASTVEGDASVNMNTGDVGEIRNYIDQTLVEKIQGFVYGASPVKTYWEKRKYQKELGASGDFSAYTCSVLIQIPSERIDQAINQAMKEMRDRSSGNLKEKVSKAMESAAEDFKKMKTGEL